MVDVVLQGLNVGPVYRGFADRKLEAIVLGWIMTGGHHDAAAHR